MFYFSPLPRPICLLVLKGSQSSFLMYIANDILYENLLCNEAAAFRVRSFQARVLVSARVTALYLGSVISISWKVFGQLLEKGDKERKKAPRRRLFIRRFTFPSALLFFFKSRPQRNRGLQRLRRNLQSEKINPVWDAEEARPWLRLAMERHMWKEFSVSVTRVFPVPGESNQGIRMLLTYPALERPTQVQLRKSPPWVGALLKSHSVLCMAGKSASIIVIPCWSARTGLTCLRSHWRTRTLIFSLNFGLGNTLGGGRKKNSRWETCWNHNRLVFCWRINYWGNSQDIILAKRWKTWWALVLESSFFTITSGHCSANFCLMDPGCLFTFYSNTIVTSSLKCQSCCLFVSVMMIDVHSRDGREKKLFTCSWILLMAGVSVINTWK